MRGHVRKRGNKWIAVIDLGRDEAGKRKQKWLSGFDTEEEAQKGATKYIYQHDIGEILDTPNITVDKYLYEWIETHKDNISIKTYASYKAEITNHLAPHFKKVKLDQLKPLHLQKYYTMKKKTHSPTTVNYHHRIIRTALNQAVKWGMLGNNPATKVTPPKKADKVTETITLAQAQEVLEYAKKNEHEMYIAIIIAFYTGMRRGEVLGLTWDKVDFKNQSIYVDQARQFVGNEIVVSGVKTKKSKRTIAIFGELSKELQKEKIKQKKDRLEWGEHYTIPDQDFICRWDNGILLRPDYVSKKFKKIATDLQISNNLRFHDLRHSNATWLMEKGVHPKIVSEMLGHSDIQTTMNIYSHVSLDMQRNAIAKIEQDIL